MPLSASVLILDPPEGKRFYKIVPVYLLFLIGPPTLVGAGPIRSPPLFIIISDPFFSATALTIFLKLGTMLDNDKRKKVAKPDYPKKNFGSSKKSKNMVKMTVFDFFSKMAPKILMKLAQNVELINSEHLAKTAC